jgi:hypothetical protein
MSSCQGELAGNTFMVKALDPSGTILINRAVTALQNGFMELWLPRSLAVYLTIEGLNRSASAVISTFDDSPTCITSMRLK